MSMKNYSIIRASSTLALICCLLLPTITLAKTVVLPVTMDYKLLTSMVSQTYFTDEDNQAILLDRYDGCLKVVLSEPRFSTRDGHLHFESRITIHGGTPVGNTCLMPLSWAGYLNLWQEPRLDPQSFALSFITRDSSLLTLDRQPAKVAGLLWNLAKPVVYEYLNQIVISLAPPVDDMKSFLLPMFAPQFQQQAYDMLASFRGGGVQVTDQALIVETFAEVQSVYTHSQAPGEKALSPEEVNQVISLWETWDSFLVQLLTTMAAQPLSPAEQQVLMDVLLDTRHTFAERLGENTMSTDMVRDQFIDSWQQLAPIFKNQLIHSTAEQTLSYLGFFTAADALKIMDDLGPTFGIEISRNGLIRLARMLNSGTSLDYMPEINNSLRQLFHLSPEPIPSESPVIEENIEVEGIPLPEEEPLSQLFQWVIPPLYAATTPTYAEILQWRVPKKDILGYVERVRTLLDTTTKNLAQSKKLPGWQQNLFTRLLPAIAWQESCFRQFVIKNKKLTYLLSYNQSSVGLMQVNERVWRGLYNQNRLRWDIHYNAFAGSEIALLYLQKYLLKKSKTLPNDQTMAQLIYAMYNGGPSQFNKFTQRKKKNKLYKSDTLFLKKWQWVQKGQWRMITQCLGGNG